MADLDPTRLVFVGGSIAAALRRSHGFWATTQRYRD